MRWHSHHDEFPCWFFYPIQVYGGPDWTKINNLVLHYGQKDLDFENDEPIKKRPPFKEISAPIMGDRDERGVRAQIGTDENAPYC